MRETMRVFSDPRPRPRALYALAATGTLLAALLAIRLDFTHPSTIGFIAMGLLGPTMAAVDVRELRLPDILTAAAAIAATLGAGLTCLSTSSWTLIVPALISAIVSAGPLYVISLVTGGGIGLGDIKLLAVIGFIVGAIHWEELIYCIAGAFIAGAIAAIITRLACRKTREIPFGPFLIGATIITGLLAPAGS